MNEYVYGCKTANATLSSWSGVQVAFSIVRP